MRNSEFGMRNSEPVCGAIACISTPHSALRTPHFRRRRGVSILEVLFAILVTTVGLLGALAVFPVASATARKGRISDASAVVGRTAIHTFDAKGYRRPDMWMGWNQTWETRSSPPAPGPSFQPLTNIDVPPLGAQSVVSFCIDPQFVSANTTNAAQANAASIFPYIPPATAPGARMFRIGVTNGIPTGTAGSALMNLLHANAVFTLDDDLAFSRPADSGLPGYGEFSRVNHDNSSGTADFPMSRASEGHLSWMATLVPQHELYAPAVITNDMYVLSVVVFYDRPLVDFDVDPIPTAAAATSATYTTENMTNLAERVAEANFTEAGGVGAAGGEALLIWPPDGTTVSDTPANQAIATRMLRLRAGDWILLSGLKSGAAGSLLQVFKWYRVSEADHEAFFDPTESHYEIGVSLTGPDWDTSLTAVPGGTTGTAQATIVTGVVAVFEKSVRLETGTGF